MKFVHLMPGDEKGMQVALRLCLGRNLNALGAWSAA